MEKLILKLIIRERKKNKKQMNKFMNACLIGFDLNLEFAIIQLNFF